MFNLPLAACAAVQNSLDLAEAGITALEKFPGTSIIGWTVRQSTTPLTAPIQLGLLSVESNIKKKWA